MPVEMVESFVSSFKANHAAVIAVGKTHRKFTESLFKFLTYGALWTYLFICIVNEPWFYDMKLVWENPPFLTPMADQYHWIYIMQDGLYFHFLVFQFLDTKRSDFWEMFLHHVCTVYLITFSYLSNKMRIGIWVLFVHDLSDIFMEMAKLTLYMQVKVVPDLIFVLFAISFFVMRLVIFPGRVIRSCFVDYWNDSIEGGYRAPVYFLCVLVGLHSYWMFLILKMIYKFMFSGQVEKDIRSESELETEEHQN
jgi:hypothetical protein